MLSCCSPMCQTLILLAAHSPHFLKPYHASPSYGQTMTVFTLAVCLVSVLMALDIISMKTATVNSSICETNHGGSPQLCPFKPHLPRYDDSFLLYSMPRLSNSATRLPSCIKRKASRSFMSTMLVTQNGLHGKARSRLFLFTTFPLMPT